MRFLISGLGLDSGGGLTVGLNVARGIAQLGGKHTYCLVFPRGCGYENIDSRPGVELRLVDVSPKALRRPYLDHRWLPGLCREWKADATFSMSNYSTWHMPCPHVLGIHKGHLLYPDVGGPQLLTVPSRIKLFLQRRYFARQVRHMDAFCVLTDVLAVRLNHLHGVPDDRIHVVPNAVAKEVSRQPDSPSELDTRLAGYANRFKLCYVAPFYPHKNHRSFIEVFKHLVHERGVKDVVVFVTIEHGARGKARVFLNDVRSAGLEPWIVNLGHLSLGDVSRVYGSSDALIMPSLLESFSNSYVEAMHHSLPILTSDLDFAHAVCDDAALYFEPTDPRDIVRSIDEIRNQEPLRMDMISRSRRRLAKLALSWEDVTERYVSVLETVAREGRSTSP